MAKKKAGEEEEVIPPEIVKLAESEASTVAAETEAKEAAEEALIAAEDRKKTEEKTGESAGEIKAVFRRASHSHETGPGDHTYTEGQEVTFQTYVEYHRWFRRGACETKEDRDVRLKGESAKAARDLRVQQGG